MPPIFLPAIDSDFAAYAADAAARQRGVYVSDASNSSVVNTNTHAATPRHADDL